MTAQEEHIKPSPALEAASRIEAPVLTEQEVAQPKTAIFGKEHSEFATFHEEYIRHYIALADTKAGVIFALATAIIGYLLNEDEIQAIILMPSYSLEFFGPILALFSLSIVAALAFLVLAPRLSAPSNEGLVFFNTVAKKASSDYFLSKIEKSSDDQLIEARLKHCYDTAKVCSQKYGALKSAIWLMPISLLLTLFTLFAT